MTDSKSALYVSLSLANVIMISPASASTITTVAYDEMSPMLRVKSPRVTFLPSTVYVTHAVHSDVKPWDLYSSMNAAESRVWIDLL